MEEEYLDLDGELLDMQPDVLNDDGAPSMDDLGLQSDLADQIGLQGNLPKFVSSLEQKDDNPNSGTPAPDAHLNNGEEKDKGNAAPINDTPTGDEEEEQEDLISIILKSKGVADPLRIKMENDKGEIEEISFNDLDYETQINLLTSKEETQASGPELKEDEVELIDYLRQNNLTVEELLEKQRQSILEEFSEQVGQIDFDEISDEDLYRLEMQSTYENLSEEEIDLLISKELEYPELFAKKITKLRNDYKEAEANREQAEAQALEEQRQAEYEEFSSSLFETAKSIEEIGGLTLNDQDKQEVLESILKPDASGISQFSRMFNDKETFFKMAWFALKGKEAFEMLHSHYKGVIEESRKEATKKPANTKTKLTFKGDVKGLKTPSTTKKKQDDGGSEFVIDDFVQ